MSTIGLSDKGSNSLRSKKSGASSISSKQPRNLSRNGSKCNSLESSRHGSAAGESVGEDASSLGPPQSVAGMSVVTGGNESMSMAATLGGDDTTTVAAYGDTATNPANILQETDVVSSPSGSPSKKIVNKKIVPVVSLSAAASKALEERTAEEATSTRMSGKKTTGILGLEVNQGDDDEGVVLPPVVVDNVQWSGKLMGENESRKFFELLHASGSGKQATMPSKPNAARPLSAGVASILMSSISRSRDVQATTTEQGIAVRDDGDDNVGLSDDEDEVDLVAHLPDQFARVGPPPMAPKASSSISGSTGSGKQRPGSNSSSGGSANNSTSLRNSNASTTKPSVASTTSVTRSDASANV